MDWFRTRRLALGVWLVAEPSLVNLWLITGTERAVLLDTGCGTATRVHRQDRRKFVRAPTALKSGEATETAAP